MYRIFLWGTGGFAKKYLSFVEELINGFDIQIVGFCDNNTNKHIRDYHGYKVYEPEILGEVYFDKVIVFVYPDTAPVIVKQLMENLRVDRDKIGYIEDILEITQRQNRERMIKKQSRAPQIFDCFTFFNELDILKIRFKLLSPYVDHFVIVEMNKTHRGKDKTLIFKKYREQYTEYLDKIIYITPEDIPEYTGHNTKAYMDYYDGDDWTLENFQRNCISRGLKDAEPEDLICISDCDEIINPLYLREFREKTFSVMQPIWMKELNRTALSLRQTFYYYYFNCVLNQKQNQSVMVKYKNLTNVQNIRHLIYFLPTLENGGWHLTYFGDIKAIINKTKAIVEGNDIEEKELEYRMQNAIDPYGRKGEGYDMHFIEKDEIDIPDIDELIEEYPQFYYRREKL